MAGLTSPWLRIAPRPQPGLTLWPVAPQPDPQPAAQQQVTDGSRGHGLIEGGGDCSNRAGRYGGGNNEAEAVPGMAQIAGAGSFSRLDVTNLQILQIGDIQGRSTNSITPFHHVDTKLIHQPRFRI